MYIKERLHRMHRGGWQKVCQLDQRREKLRPTQPSQPCLSIRDGGKGGLCRLGRNANPIHG